MPKILVADFIYEGNCLLEVEKNGTAYTVRVTDTGVRRDTYLSDLTKEREVLDSKEFTEKPTVTEINAWLNANRWFTFYNKAGVVNEILALLPP